MNTYYWFRIYKNSVNLRIYGDFFLFPEKELRNMRVPEELKRKLSFVEDLIFYLFALDEFEINITDNEEININFKLQAKNKIFF